jgi:hypothetical protein
MLDALLPRRLDNEYRGSRLALWLFGLVVAMKSAQSLAIILNGYATARDVDGIPLNSFGRRLDSALLGCAVSLGAGPAGPRGSGIRDHHDAAGRHHAPRVAGLSLAATPGSLGSAARSASCFDTGAA